MTTQRSLEPRSVFVDSSAFYALIDDRDRNHGAAAGILSRLANEASRLFTTNLILAETHALLLSRLGRQIALQFLDDVDAGNTTVVRVAAGEEQRARAILRQYDDKDFSLTDATSFAVMERLKINAAFSFDSDFSQFGWSVLLLS